jgi:hypothetical protein
MAAEDEGKSLSTWQYVNSSWVDAIRYDDETQELLVRFNSGVVCAYSADYAEALAMLRAGSKGKFVWRNLYTRSYRIV